MTRPAERPTVAFVDDEPMVLNGLRRLLRGYAERWDMHFYEGAEAFWKDRSGDWPTVAVLDLNMPGWSGLDLAKALRGAGAATRCIMLTGNAGLKDAMAFINEAAVYRYYMKPCVPELLAEGVEAALADAVRERDDAARRSAPDPAGVLADRLAIGTVLLDRDQHVVFANKAAMRQIGAGCALATDAGNRLRATTAAAGQALSQAIQAATDNGHTTVVSLEAPGDGHPLHVTVSSEGKGEDQRVTLFLNDPARVQYPDAGTLRQLFGLTGSESRLVERLVQGQSLEEAAETNGLKIASARTYLKSVFQKMGVSRQAELVQRALTASASMVLTDDA